MAKITIVLEDKENGRVGFETLPYDVEKLKAKLQARECTPAEEMAAIALAQVLKHSMEIDDKQGSTKPLILL